MMWCTTNLNSIPQLAFQISSNVLASTFYSDSVSDSEPQDQYVSVASRTVVLKFFIVGYPTNPRTEQQEETVGKDISSKDVDDNVRTVGKTMHEPHKLTYAAALKKSIE